MSFVDPEHAPGGWHVAGFDLPPRVPQSVVPAISRAIAALVDPSVDAVNAIVDRMVPRDDRERCALCGTADERAGVHSGRCRRCFRDWRQCAHCGRVYPARDADDDTAECLRCAADDD